MNNRQIKFKNWKEMYDTLQAGTDLYNPNIEKYVFIYNSNGALCTYNLQKEEAIKIKNKANDVGDSWSSVLGTGGYILDDLSLSMEESLQPSYDFCKDYCMADGWTCV